MIIPHEGLGGRGQGRAGPVSPRVIIPHEGLGDAALLLKMSPERVIIPHEGSGEPRNRPDYPGWGGVIIPHEGLGAGRRRRAGRRRDA